MPFLSAFAFLHAQIECSSIDGNPRSRLFVPPLISYPYPCRCILKSIRQRACLHVPCAQRRHCRPMLRASPTSPFHWCCVKHRLPPRSTPRPSFSCRFQDTPRIFIQPQPRGYPKVAFPPSGLIRAGVVAPHRPIHLGIWLHSPPPVHVLVLLSWVKPPGSHNSRRSC